MPCMLRPQPRLLRYSFYTNMECVRMYAITPDRLYRKRKSKLEQGDGKLMVLFAGSTIGSKAFAVDMETADMFVRHAPKRPGC